MARYIERAIDAGRRGAQSIQRRPILVFGGLFVIAASIYAALAVDAGDTYWETRTVDAVVRFAPVVFIGLGCAYGLLKAISADLDRRKPGDLSAARADFLLRARRSLLQMAVVVFALLGFYVTYATFRNQLRLSAESDINTESMEVFNIEMASPELRCLYDNYSGGDPNACLRNLVENPASWSKAIFYVEEAWDVLERAQRDRATWGSEYADTVALWAEDVEEDPTGLFTYYLFAAMPADEARDYMRRTDIPIPDVCGKYWQVRRALVAAKVGPADPPFCPDPLAAAPR